MAVKTREAGLNDSSLINRDRSGNQKRWWHEAPGPERARLIVQAVENIEREQEGRRAMDQLHMQMYAGGNASGLGMSKMAQWRASQKVTLRLNLAQQICDAMEAKVAKLRPRPRILTTGGDWGLRKKAEAMEQAIDGEFYRNDVDGLGPKVAMDSFQVGDGSFRVGRRNQGHPVIERTMPGEVLVDYMDGYRGSPRCMYQTQLIDRDYLEMTLAPRRNKKLAQVIRQADTASASKYAWLFPRPGHSHHVYLIEAWHLPSYPDAGDGAYSMLLGTEELLEPAQTKYEFGAFPFATMSWQPRPYGYYSKGIIEEITPQQIEINYTLEKIQYILHNVSTVRHWIQAGGRIELRAQKMTNTPGEIMKFYGPNPPITDVVNAVPRELFEHVMTLKNDAFESVGLSQFFATASKPAGLNSGEAQRVYEDVGTERLILKGRSYEGAHMELAKRIVDCKHDIASNPHGEVESPVPVKSKRARGVTIKTLNFKQSTLEESQYMWEVLPQSALPGTPSGRQAALFEWLQIGAITQEEFRELSQMPDLKAHHTPTSTTRDNVLSAIEAIADDGQYSPPHSMLDLTLAKILVASAFNRLQWEGLPEDKLEMIARYASELVDLEQMAMAPEAGQALAPSPMEQQAAAMSAQGGAMPGMPVGAPPMLQ